MSSHSDRARPAPGDVFTAPYPFVRSTFENFDAEGPATVDSWKPGADLEVEYDPYSGDRTIAFADGVGSVEYTVVDVHKPGHFPTRVFFTRQWVSPDGTRFGKRGLHIATLEKFRRLCRGYSFPYTIA